MMLSFVYHFPVTTPTDHFNRSFASNEAQFVYFYITFKARVYFRNSAVLMSSRLDERTRRRADYEPAS